MPKRKEDQSAPRRSYICVVCPAALSLVDRRHRGEGTHEEREGCAEHVAREGLSGDGGRGVKEVCFALARSSRTSIEAHMHPRGN